MPPWRHAITSEQHHAEEGCFEEERREYLVAEQRAGDVAGFSMKPGQLVPNWKLMVMPDTTPSEKVGAKILAHRR